MGSQDTPSLIFGRWQKSHLAPHHGENFLETYFSLDNSLLKYQIYFKIDEAVICITPVLTSESTTFKNL